MSDFNLKSYLKYLKRERGIIIKIIEETKTEYILKDNKGNTYFFSKKRKVDD